MDHNAHWYTINNTDEIDSPTILIYTDRVKQNIQTFINSVDSIDRLRPHVKTHKSAEVSRWMIDAGIKKFKCATIAEAEMLASTGATEILMAYQPVGPKVKRLAQLAHKFPAVKFSALIDNQRSAAELSAVFLANQARLPVYIDLNIGMNRTGIIPDRALALFEACKTLEGIMIVGLHAYDGHLRDEDFSVRTKRCNESFAAVEKLKTEIESRFNVSLIIIAGGSPTFSIHRNRKEVECSPGTFIYWDRGYEQALKEQHYLFAALVLTRVVSTPAENIICVDLGHKAIASENPLPNRVYFLNAPELEPIGHSEEHMTLKCKDKSYQIGDILYAVPYHVCPTVALYDRPVAVHNHQVVEFWNTTSRNRKITI